MHKVIINIICLKTGKFFLKIAVEGCIVINKILRKLCRNLYLVADIVFFQDCSQGSFTSGINIGCIKIIYTGIVSFHDFFFRFINVDSTHIGCKTHATIA